MFFLSNNEKAKKTVHQNIDEMIQELAKETDDNSTQTKIVNDKEFKSSQLIVLDVSVKFKEDGSITTYKNVGRLNRIPALLRISQYNNKNKEYTETLVPLDSIENISINPRVIKNWRKKNKKA